MGYVEQGGNIPEDDQGIRLKDGLNALYFPDLGKRDKYGELEPLSSEELLIKVRSFLDSISSQGGEIVTRLDVKVNLGERNIPGELPGDEIQERILFIIKK